MLLAKGKSGSGSGSGSGGGNGCFDEDHPNIGGQAVHKESSQSSSARSQRRLLNNNGSGVGPNSISKKQWSVGERWAQPHVFLGIFLPVLLATILVFLNLNLARVMVTVQSSSSLSLLSRNEDIPVEALLKLQAFAKQRQGGKRANRKNSTTSNDDDEEEYSVSASNLQRRKHNHALTEEADHEESVGEKLETRFFSLSEQAQALSSKDHAAAANDEGQVQEEDENDSPDNVGIINDSSAGSQTGQEENQDNATLKQPPPPPPGENNHNFMIVNTSLLLSRTHPSLDNRISNGSSSTANTILQFFSNYVDGEWVYCGRPGTLFVDMRDTKPKKPKAFIDLISNDTEACPRNLDLLWFRPMRLFPILPGNESSSSSSSSSSNTASNTTVTNVSASSKGETEQEQQVHNMEYHRYTPYEARQCLKNKRILMIGDSHMRNLWRGVHDILSGVLSHEYFRWDGYHDFGPDFDDVDPIPPGSEKLKLLPSALYAWQNDYIKLGVPKACELRPKKDRLLDFKGMRRYWKCQSGKTISDYRRDFDLRELESDACRQHNITLHMSWCAGSFRDGLKYKPKTKGPQCRDARIFMYRPRDNSSFLERLILSQPYDLVVVGHHVHDVKRENCLKNKKDSFEVCRAKLGKKLIANTLKFASWAKLHNIPVLWVTCGPMNRQLIPAEYHLFQRANDFDYEMRQMAQIMARHGFPVLDIFHMGDACRQQQMRAAVKNGETWPPCLSDGMHGSRFLDRMRAQMLLNWQCQR